MSKALYSDFTIERARALALSDWRRDTNPHAALSGAPPPSVLNRPRQKLRYADYRKSLFELADTWTSTLDPTEYVHFLQTLYHRIVQLPTNEARVVQTVPTAIPWNYGSVKKQIHNSGGRRKVSLPPTIVSTTGKKATFGISDADALSKLPGAEIPLHLSPRADAAPTAIDPKSPLGRLIRPIGSPRRTVPPSPQRKLRVTAASIQAEVDAAAEAAEAAAVAAAIVTAATGNTAPPLDGVNKSPIKSPAASLTASLTAPPLNSDRFIFPSATATATSSSGDGKPTPSTSELTAPATAAGIEIAGVTQASGAGGGGSGSAASTLPSEAALGMSPRARARARNAERRQQIALGLLPSSGIKLPTTEQLTQQRRSRRASELPKELLERIRRGEITQTELKELVLATDKSSPRHAAAAAEEEAAAERRAVIAAIPEAERQRLQAVADAELRRLARIEFLRDNDSLMDKALTKYFRSRGQDRPASPVLNKLKEILAGRMLATSQTADALPDSERLKFRLKRYSNGAGSDHVSAKPLPRSERAKLNLPSEPLPPWKVWAREIESGQRAAAGGEFVLSPTNLDGGSGYGLAANQRLPSFRSLESIEALESRTAPLPLVASPSRKKSKHQRRDSKSPKKSGAAGSGSHHRSPLSPSQSALPIDGVITNPTQALAALPQYTPSLFDEDAPKLSDEEVRELVRSLPPDLVAELVVWLAKDGRVIDRLRFRLRFRLHQPHQPKPLHPSHSDPQQLKQY